MPELPEVHTTSTVLNRLIVGKKIKDVWTSYNSPYFKGKEQIKDPAYFHFFKKEIIGEKVLSVKRRAKNVLINLSGDKTILIHMKMTGHLLYGKYKKVGKEWVTENTNGPLADPFNGYIRLVFTLDGDKKLVLSDVRKFAKVKVLKTSELSKSEDLKDLGPEPLEKDFDLNAFIKCLPKNKKIKTALMDQSCLAGVGNIYSDEALWLSKIHPETMVDDISKRKMGELYKNVIFVLKKGIDFRGDSTSDYRMPDGRPGEFQMHHNVYRRKDLRCKRKKCRGKIERIVVGVRSTHFCPKCQKAPRD